MNRMIAAALICAAGLTASNPGLAQNLITNGDFEQGNTGFSSQYQYNPNSTSQFFNGQYNLASSSGTAFPAGFGSTQFNAQSGSLALFADGSQDAGQAVYSTVVSGLTPFSAYTFSFYAANANPDPALRAILQVENGGVPIFTFTPSVGSYSLGQVTIVAQSSTLSLSIRDLFTSPGGNDFSIDNVSLVAATPVAVPGPIAGAGIPALLALAGTMFARRRRSQAPSA